MWPQIAAQLSATPQLSHQQIEELLKHVPRTIEHRLHAAVELLVDHRLQGEGESAGFTGSPHMMYHSFALRHLCTHRPSGFRMHIPDDADDLLQLFAVKLVNSTSDLYSLVSELYLTAIAARGKDWKLYDRRLEQLRFFAAEQETNLQRCIG